MKNFSVTVALEEDDGFYWTSLKKHQNISFQDVMSICKGYKYYKVYWFDSVNDAWCLIEDNSENL